MIYCSTVLNSLTFHNCCEKLWITRENICIFLSLFFAWYCTFKGLNRWKGKQMKKSESMIITCRNSKEWRRSKNALCVVYKPCCLILWKIIFYSVWKKVSFYCPYFAEDKVPLYPSKDKVKDYSECCGDKCCTKVSA